MTSPIARYRARAFNRQSGLCFYCGCPMWDGRADAFIARYKLSSLKRCSCNAQPSIYMLALTEARIASGTSSQPADFAMHGDTIGRPHEIRLRTGCMFSVAWIEVSGMPNGPSTQWRLWRPSRSASPAFSHYPGATC